MPCRSELLLCCVPYLRSTTRSCWTDSRDSLRVTESLPLLIDRSGGMLPSVTDRSGMSKPTDLVQGTLDLLILKTIALEPMHGWAIAQRIRQMSGDVLQVGQGALYPALHKLEQQGWIDAEWKMSENNR